LSSAAVEKLHARGVELRAEAPLRVIVGDPEHLSGL
jgi:hypothetical protein